MNETENKILSHIICDYKYGILWNEARLPIFEEVGYVPEIDKYVAGFQDFVRKKIFPYIKDGGTYSATITSPSELGVEKPFFNSCRISIIASVRDGIAQWSSYYDQDKSSFSENYGYVDIKITAGASDGAQLMHLLSANFAHELTHAYDDYNATINSKKSLSAAAKKSSYADRLLVWNFGDNSNKRLIGQILYLMSTIERNAIIGQVKTEISGYDVSTPRKAMEAIKSTNAYKTYLFLKNAVEAINSTSDRMVQQDFLNAYNMVGANKTTNKNPDADYSPRENLTYEGFLSEINSMFRKWERKFLNSVGKIAYLQYLYNGGQLTNSYSDDEKIQSRGDSTINEGFDKDREYSYSFDKDLHRFVLKCSD